MGEKHNKSNNNEKIIDRIKNIIESNSIDNIDMINEIVKLIINEMNIDIVVNNNNLYSSQNTVNNTLGQLSEKMDKLQTNQQNISTPQLASNSNQENINNGDETEEPNAEKNYDAATTKKADDSTVTTDAILKNVTDMVTNINILKTQLCMLPLNPCEREYINNDIVPILDVIGRLTGISSNFSFSISTLSTSPIVPRDKSEIKEVINVMYSMNDISCDLYKNIKKRLEHLIKCSK